MAQSGLLGSGFSPASEGFEEWGVLALVSRHPSEDVIQEDDGLIDVRSLVQHHALGSLPHSRIGDLSPRRAAGAGEFVQDFGGPDDREVCGFRKPEDFLLHFRQALVAGFHGEVSSGDHDADERGAHGVEQEFGESSEGGGGLDFQDESEVLSSERFEVPVYVVDVAFVAQEGYGQHVGVGGGDFQ